MNRACQRIGIKSLFLGLAACFVAAPSQGAAVRFELERLPAPVQVTDFAIAGNGRFYVAAGRHGLVRRDPGGGNWHFDAVGLPNGEVHAVEDDPRDPESALAIVVQDVNGLARVLRTRDGGKTWVALAPEARFERAFFDPLAAGRAWLVSQNQLYELNEHGQVEQEALFPLLGTSWYLSDFARTEAGLFLAIESVCPDGVDCGPFPTGATGVMRSLDGGSSWQQVLAVGTSRIEVLQGTPGWLVAATRSGLKFSADNGTTWADQGLASRRVYAFEQVSDGTWVVVVQSLEQPFLAEFLISSDSITWQTWVPPFELAALGDFELDPVDVPYIAAAGGITADGLWQPSGDSWEQALAEEPWAAEVYDIARVPGSTLAYFATREGLFRREEGGSFTRTPAAATCGDGCQVAVSPGSPERVVFAYDTNEDTGIVPFLFKSEDQGASFAPLLGGSIGPAELPSWGKVSAIDFGRRGDSETILVALEEARAGQTGLLRSSDGGASFTLLLPGEEVSDLAVDPRDRRILYAVVQPYFLYVSTDGGDNFTKRSYAGAPSRKVAVDGDGTVYGLVQGPYTSICRSNQQGQTWDFLLLPIHIEAIAISAAGVARPGQLLLGSAQGGVFVSDDRGASWFQLDRDLGAPILSLAYDQEGAVLAGTAARGLHRRLAPVEEALVLDGGRFGVEVVWRDFLGRAGRGSAQAETRDTGYFWFFDRNNIELMIKVLDGRHINGHFWVFFGAATNVEMTIYVFDRLTGHQAIYYNPLGTFASQGDIAALPAEEDGVAINRPGPFSAFLPNTATFLHDRFEISAVWATDEDQGPAFGHPVSPDTTALYFFDPNNLELLVKVLDGRHINGHFWVFYGASSNVEFTLRVKDTLTGEIRDYSNPAGVFASKGDIEAF